jgi:hypothetical protein
MMAEAKREAFLEVARRVPGKAQGASPIRRRMR